MTRTTKHRNDTAHRGLVPMDQLATGTPDGTKFVRDDNTLAVPPGTGQGLPLGLTGATAATRYVGGTASGAPITGTFAVGDFIIDQSGAAWVCTGAGTPGTWAELGAGGASLELTDGTHDVTAVAKITVTGATVGGTTPNATLTVTSSVTEIGVCFDGGGSILSAGKVQDVPIPAAGTITSWTLLADVLATCTISVQSCTYAAYDAFGAIDGGNSPALSGPAKKNTDSTLAGWSPSLASGAILRFTLSAVTLATRLVLVLRYTRS